MKEIIDEGAAILMHASRMVQAMVKTFEKEVGKIEIKFAGGRLTKKVRPIIAQQLRVLAELIENPGKKVKLLEFKKKKTKKK